MDSFYGLKLDEEQQALVSAIRNMDKLIVFCDAPAGTGTSTIAMGAANILVVSVFDGMARRMRHER